MIKHGKVDLLPPAPTNLKLDGVIYESPLNWLGLPEDPEPKTAKEKYRDGYDQIDWGV